MAAPPVPPGRPPTQPGLLLFPGAGAGRDQSALVALDRAAAAAGWVVERVDFPYRRAGRRAPDRPAVLLRAVREAAEELAGRCSALVLGGRSMGGRMCSQAVAEGDVPVAVAGLVLLSYPLHPPGRPERMRSDHFPALACPCLFVSGDRDQFGTPEELRREAAAIRGPVELHFLAGKDHAMRNADEQVASLAVGWLARLDQLSERP